jgi:glycine oxidase
LRSVQDVVVVGGGVIGLSIARALARTGASVTVFDAGHDGGASVAAAGMLSPLDETGDGGPFHDLADASLELFADYVAALELESGIDVEFRAAGKLHVAITGRDEALLEPLAASSRAAYFGVERLDGAAARALEPELSDAVRCGVLVQRDYRVDNRRLRDALAVGCEGAGVRVERGARVSRIIVEAGEARGVMASGHRVSAGSVVLAAGVWSGELAGAGGAMPVRAVRGQMLAVRTAAPLFRRVIATPRCYVIPRADGRLLIGATVEEVGLTAGTSGAALTALREAAAEVVPKAGSLPEVESWYGFRPATPDGLPILGEDSHTRGLFHATGHYRNGILLAPVTGECIAAAVTGGVPPVLLDAFSPARFDHSRQAGG